MPSRNEPCPCGSGRKYKRCCLEQADIVTRELRARDELMGDVIAWLKAEHEQTLRDASSETMLLRIMGGATGRNTSLIWTLSDYLPADGGQPLMARYADLPKLSASARAIARGLAQARLNVYRVRSSAPGAWLELEPLARVGSRTGDEPLPNSTPCRLAWRDGLEQLQPGEILLARVVHATTVPTVWGLCERFAADTERRWMARLECLPADSTQTALTLLGFRPDDAAEPLADSVELHALSWSIDDDEAVLETIEQEDLWKSLGVAIPSGWAFAWPGDPAHGDTDLGRWHEDDGQIEIARLIVDEQEICVLSADRQTLDETARHLEVCLRGLIAPHTGRLAA